METSVAKSAVMAAYAMPEVRAMFGEWARSVEDEMRTVLKARGQVDLSQLAGQLKVRLESALCFLGKLVLEGKAAIFGIRATCAPTDGAFEGFWELQERLNRIVLRGVGQGHRRYLGGRRDGETGEDWRQVARTVREIHAGIPCGL